MSRKNHNKNDQSFTQAVNQFADLLVIFIEDMEEEKVIKNFSQESNYK